MYASETEEVEHDIDDYDDNDDDDEKTTIWKKNHFNALNYMCCIERHADVNERELLLWMH